jgi:Zn-finger nucleic acid-binding protein
MDTVGLAARYGRQVQVDVCDGCGGLWFDNAESQQLSPGATLTLLARLTLRPSRAVQGRSPCPRCRQTLLDVQDQQRATKFSYRRCPAAHGRFITAYHFLREKHLVRELTSAEIDEVRARIQQVNCVNCGAPVALSGALACGHCGTPVSMVDPQQLRRELDTLVAADSIRGVDPTLPLRLLRERAVAERVWATLPDDRTWVDDLMSHDTSIAHAAIRLLGRRVG